MRARIKPTKLHEFSDFRQPRWSADGKRIIAVGGFLDLAGPNGNRMELWTMNKDGSQAQRVTSNNLWDEMPALSPKQDQIAFVRHFTDESGDYVTVHGMDLYIMNTDAKNERQLTNNKETSGKARTGYYNRVSTPLFNLAGNQIAFTQNGIIYRIDSDGQNLKRMGGGDLLQWIW
jgi:Tol biopolymer transport system component